MNGSILTYKTNESVNHCLRTSSTNKHRFHPGLIHKFTNSQVILFEVLIVSTEDNSEPHLVQMFEGFLVKSSMVVKEKHP